MLSTGNQGQQMAQRSSDKFSISYPRTSPDVPDANHIKHAEQHTIQTRQYFWIVNDLVHYDEPFYEPILGAQGRFAFSLAERTDDGDDDIRGHSLSRVQVLD